MDHIGLFLLYLRSIPLSFIVVYNTQLSDGLKMR